MVEEVLRREKKERIVFLTLNRPEKMNAFNLETLAALEEALDEAEVNPGVKVIVLKGNEKVFSAGADISQLSAFTSPLDALAFLQAGHRVMNKIEGLSKPVIAAVGGLAFGGGCEVTLACDFRIASEKARFGVPEINLGSIPGWGGTVRLPRLIGAAKAKELLFTGRPITAEEAFRIGLVNLVVPHERLLEETEKFALELVEKPGQALRIAKIIVNTQFGLDINAAVKLESQGVTYLFTTEDLAEGTRAFLEKRKPTFKDR